MQDGCLLGNYNDKRDPEVDTHHTREEYNAQKEDERVVLKDLPGVKQTVKAKE